jgi:hypothetical protein
MSKQRRAQSALLPVSPLLMTESEAEFDRVRDAFDQEIKPRGIIEQMHVADVAYLTWEILQLRRCKAGIINSAFCAALERLLVQALRKPGGFNLDVEDEAGRLAREWFIDPEAKKQVSGLLKNFQLDETAIEAEAIRTSAEDLERLDRLLASLESRRNKVLRCIADYRGGFARQLHESGDRMIDGKVLALEKPSSKKPSAAA